MEADGVEALVQEAVTHLEASFAKGNKYAHYPFEAGTPAPVIRAVFEQVREHFYYLIARLDRRPAGSNAPARIYLTNAVPPLKRRRLTPK